jgi:hypothetical protein
MMEIQQLSSTANLMSLYGQIPAGGAKKAAARPPVQIENNIPDAPVLKNLSTKPVLFPENKIPKVEEIKEMIQNNGYPFKSDIYKAIARIVESDLN